VGEAIARSNLECTTLVGTWRQGDDGNHWNTRAANHTSAVVDEVNRTGRPTLVTKNGRPVAVLAAIDEEESSITSSQLT